MMVALLQTMVALLQTMVALLRTMVVVSEMMMVALHETMVVVSEMMMVVLWVRPSSANFRQNVVVVAGCYVVEVLVGLLKLTEEELS